MKGFMSALRLRRIYHSNHWMRVSVAIFLFNITMLKCAVCQSIPPNKYGLIVIDKTNILKNEIAQDSNQKMGDLRKLIPGIILDLKYATVDNFMHEKLYPSTNTTFLRKPAADSLKKVIAYLRKRNLTVKIFDAYRPYSVTEKMWEKVKDSRYAADPSKGSGHNRGAAVALASGRTGHVEAVETVRRQRLGAAGTGGDARTGQSLRSGALEAERDPACGAGRRVSGRLQRRNMG